MLKKYPWEGNPSHKAKRGKREKRKRKKEKERKKSTAVQGSDSLSEAKEALPRQKSGSALFRQDQKCDTTKICSTVTDFWQEHAMPVLHLSLPLAEQSLHSCPVKHHPCTTTSEALL